MSKAARIRLRMFEQKPGQVVTTIAPVPLQVGNVGVTSLQFSQDIKRLLPGRTSVCPAPLGLQAPPKFTISVYQNHSGHDRLRKNVIWLHASRNVRIWLNPNRISLGQTNPVSNIFGSVQSGGKRDFRAEWA